MLRRLPGHPLLLAAFPVLLLWGQNGADVPPGDGLSVLLVALAAAAGVTAVAAVAMRDALGGALVGSAVVVVALAHGHLWGSAGSARLLPGLLVAAVLVVLAVVRVRSLEAPARGRATLALNLVGLLLLAGTLPGVVGSVRAAAAVDVVGAAGPAVADGDGTTPQRDVVWIVPDRHGSEVGLGQTFGLDTSGFTTALEERGFTVAPAARANYPTTSHALASSLGLDYLDDLAATVPSSGRSSRAALHARIADNEVARRLTAAGYHYVHLGSWWEPTADAPLADTVLVEGRDGVLSSEFAQVFLDTTVVGPLRRPSEEPGYRERHRTYGLWQLDQLDAIAAQLADDLDDAPRFVFAHVLLPHEPYVFERDGSPVAWETETSRSRAENFTRQLDYLHTRLLPVLDRLAAVPDDREPIVLLQADEGPHPERLELGDEVWRWGDATDAELVTKLSILSALRVPGEDVTVRPDVTAVNMARRVVGEALGEPLEELPDRSYVFDDPSDRYAFVPVDDRLDAAG